MKIKKQTLIRIFVFIVIIALIAWVAVEYRSYINPTHLQMLLTKVGLWAPVIFILIYIAATIFFLPGTILTLAGGLIFGPIYGTVYNLTGATIGATLAFIVARYLASDWVARKSGPRLKPIMDGIAKEGWQFVAFLRLVPLFPFNLLNYALGLTKIRISHFVIASAIFMIPGTFAYTYLGYVGAEAAKGSKGIIQKALVALALLAAVAFLARIVKLVHDKKSKKKASNSSSAGSP